MLNNYYFISKIARQKLECVPQHSKFFFHFHSQNSCSLKKKIKIEKWENFPKN
jgi:hypothetical protein